MAGLVTPDPEPNCRWPRCTSCTSKVAGPAQRRGPAPQGPAPAGQGAAAPELRAAFARHAALTEGQSERLGRILSELGVKAGGKKCKALAGMIAAAKDVLAADAHPAVLDLALITKAHRIEYSEIVGYEYEGGAGPTPSDSGSRTRPPSWPRPWRKRRRPRSGSASSPSPSSCSKRWRRRRAKGRGLPRRRPGRRRRPVRPGDEVHPTARPDADRRAAIGPLRGSGNRTSTRFPPGRSGRRRGRRSGRPA